MFRAVVTVVALAVPTAIGAQEMASSSAGRPASADPPIFEAHDPIQMSISADFDALKDDRDQEEEEREGSVVVTTPSGASLNLDLQIRTRGNFRLKEKTCRFPPLRLNFKKGQLEGTFLDGQDKLKLVTHCRDEDRYEQNVLKEYLVYRMYNELTDRSFRVRLARVTYNDTSGENDPVTRWAFLIEDDDLMAERLGGTLLETETIHPARMRGENTGPVNLFQYMVGNTDFSLFQDHNAKLVDDGSTVIPVPYDFDWTGFVDAPYAKPDPKLPIRNVKQRIYRGLCRADVDYQALYQSFLAKRPAMEELVRSQVGLDEDEMEDSLDYLDDFWETIGDPDKARKNIEEQCRSI